MNQAGWMTNLAISLVIPLRLTSVIMVAMLVHGSCAGLQYGHDGQSLWSFWLTSMVIMVMLDNHLDHSCQSM